MKFRYVEFQDYSASLQSDFQFYCVFPSTQYCAVIPVSFGTVHFSIIALRCASVQSCELSCCRWLVAPQSFTATPHKSVKTTSHQQLASPLHSVIYIWHFTVWSHLARYETVELLVVDTYIPWTEWVGWLVGDWMGERWTKKVKCEGTKRRLCKNRPKIRFPTRCDVNEHDRTQTVIELRKLWSSYVNCNFRT